VGLTRKGKGTKWMVVVDGQGIPLGHHLDSAQFAEITLAQNAIQNVKVPRRKGGRPRTRPKRIIADKAYDSNKLRDELEARGIELITPHLKTRKTKRQDGRSLKRYRHRWIIERTFSWLHNFKRIRTRDDRLLVIYAGFFHLALMLLALRKL
jgi:transposase